MFEFLIYVQPVLKRPLTGEVTLEKVVSSLPALPRSKAGEVQKVLEALTKVTNHKLHLRDQEVKTNNRMSYL